MARQASKDVRRLLQIEKIQAYVERHMQEAEENVSRSAKQYVRDLCERFGDPYRGFREPADINLNSIEEIMRKDPLLGIPVSARDLLESSAVPKGMDMGQIDRLSIPYEGLISKCHVVGITKSELTGHPLQAEEVHTGPGGPTLPVPECYAWAQPNLGRLEIVSHLANSEPGIHQVGSYSYNLSSAHLAAAYPLAITEPRDVTISAQPWLSGQMRHGSVTAPMDVSGYSVTITLSAKAIVAGSSASYTVVPANSLGLVAGMAYGVDVQYWPTLSVELKTAGYDLVLMTLTLTAMTLQRTGSSGWALVDIDGATAPPGKSMYHSSGCLDLPGFVVRACAP